MRNRIRNNRKYILLGLPALFILLLLTASIPPIRERLAGRVDLWRAQIEYMLDPPEEAIFVPQEQRQQIALMVSGTLQALTPSVTPTNAPVGTATTTPLGPTLTPSTTPTPTATPTPLPATALLTGVEYHHQHGVWNYCGPATLAMGLSYWGWGGDRYDTGGYLRGGLDREDDKNVMPYEMQNYVQDETNLRMLVRMGGELPLLKALIAGGYPVIVEKDFELEGVGWMGHYLLLTGYDDSKSEFVSMDAYRGENMRYGYEEVLNSWRAFNYTFMVTYPPGQGEDVLALLGPWADEDWAVQHALDIARGEVLSLTGKDEYFAWFNLGTSYVNLRDYGSAASAFDSAFARYAELPKEERPWRMVWYQTGPYFAYFYTGRYYDVINLADTTLDAMKDPILEESFYWRGLAKEELGDLDGAVADLQESVRLNPNFAPGLAQLNRIQNGG